MMRDARANARRTTVHDNLEEVLQSTEMLPQASRRSFLKLFKRYQGSLRKAMDWKQVRPPRPEFVIPLSSLEQCPKDSSLQHELLDKLVILKLNGGLGTTMGCKGPKSVIEVRQDLTFLDLTVRQVEYLNTFYGVDVPLVLMNSFNTHEETVRVIRKFRMHNLTIHTFNQSCFPLILKESMMPLPTGRFDPQTSEQWYPPGHGDVYSALFESGLLETLINQGKEYVFISNIDNLGATVDLNVLYHMINTDSEFIMELTDKTRADVKGGTLVEIGDKLQLLEMGQVPKEHMGEFQSLNKFKIFNTNNLWVDLRAIQRLVARDMMDLEPIPTFRSVNGSKILQLETAAASAIQFFKNSFGLHVSRKRFLPVKSTSDLFLIQSNLYNIKHGSLEMNPERDFPSIPVVKLGRYFEKVQDFLDRLPHGIPNILELDYLTVAGDVSFGSDVALKIKDLCDPFASLPSPFLREFTHGDAFAHTPLQGTVIIVANESSRIDLPDGTVLENKVVTGNLRLLDH